MITSDGPTVRRKRLLPSAEVVEQGGAISHLTITVKWLVKYHRGASLCKQLPLKPIMFSWGFWGVLMRIRSWECLKILLLFVSLWAFSCPLTMWFQNWSHKRTTEGKFQINPTLLLSEALKKRTQSTFDSPLWKYSLTLLTYQCCKLLDILCLSAPSQDCGQKVGKKVKLKSLHFASLVLLHQKFL